MRVCTAVHGVVTVRNYYMLLLMRCLRNPRLTCAATGMCRSAVSRDGMRQRTAKPPLAEVGKRTGISLPRVSQIQAEVEGNQPPELL